MTGPLPLDQVDLVRRLRDVLVAAQFTAEKIGDALGTADEIVARLDSAHVCPLKCPTLCQSTGAA